MKKTLKRILWIAGGLVIVGFMVFLYLIPPFTSIPQEEFIRPTQSAGPSLEGITVEPTRLIAKRGEYLVHVAGCNDCHTPQGERGPEYSRYLSGGIMLATKAEGASFSANLTSDKETGLGNVSDEAIMRALRSGIHDSGRSINYRAMPWASFSQMSDEDLYAIITYLRQLKGVRNHIPAPTKSLQICDAPFNAEVFFPGDFGTK